jgi:hypothetical protein
MYEIKIYVESRSSVLETEVMTKHLIMYIFINSPHGVKLALWVEGPLLSPPFFKRLEFVHYR